MASLFGKLKRAISGDDAPETEMVALTGDAPAAGDDALAPPPAKKQKKEPKKQGCQGRRLGDLRRLRGRAAILFTCPTRMERKACHEAWELLTNYVGDAEPTSSSQQSLAASLQDEAAASKASGISTYDLGSSGVGWATLDGPDVVDLATRMLRDARDDPASLAAGARLVIRIAPMQHVCFASLQDLVAGAAPLVRKAFGGLRTTPAKACVEALEAAPKRDEEALKESREKAAAETPCAVGDAPRVTYAVRIQRRSAAGFPKDIAIGALAALVPPQHAVNLKTPDVTILVEVFKSLCGVAVVPGYQSLCDGNLHAAAGKRPLHVELNNNKK